MKILAVDTSAANVALCALELGDDATAQVQALATHNEARRLSQDLLLLIESTLGHAKWTLDDVDALAVGLGPGSWTGLRIGLSAVKTLAQVRELPLAGVPTYDALAQAAWRALDDEEQRLLLVTAPCRPGEVYGKIFESHSDYLMVAQNEWIASEQMLVDTLLTQAMARGIEASPIVVGGSQSLLQLLVNNREEPFEVQVSTESMIVEVALAGALQIVNGESGDPMAVQPLYIAPSAAERNFNITV